MSFHFGSSEFHKVLALGQEMRGATKNYNQAFAEAEKDIDPLLCWDEPEFFVLLKKLQTHLFGSGSNRRNPERAIHEFIRECVNDGNYFDAMRFAKTYGLLSEEIAARLGSAHLEYGDDGFNDLCDSLVLGGKKVIEAILSATVEDDDELLQLISSVVVGRESGANKRFILHGENYIRMNLSDSLKRFFFKAADDWAKLEAEANNLLNEAASLKEDNWFDD